MQFTHEMERATSLAFLGSLVTILQDKLPTAVNIRETKAGNGTNYKSACPKPNKTEVKWSVCRCGYKFLSDW